MQLLIGIIKMSIYPLSIFIVMAFLIWEDFKEDMW